MPGGSAEGDIFPYSLFPEASNIPSHQGKLVFLLGYVPLGTYDTYDTACHKIKVFRFTIWVDSTPLWLNVKDCSLFLRRKKKI